MEPELVGQMTGQGPKFVVGLTGGIACGKSTVLRFLEESGFAVLDVDRYAKRALQKKGAPFQKIVERFGTGVIDSQGRIKREALRKKILKDPEERRFLEGVVHPEVLRQLTEDLKDLSQKGVRIVIVEVPLLFEAGWEACFDVIVTVVADNETSIKRLMTRHGVDRDTAIAWIRLQMPSIEKARRSDYVIHNDKDMDSLRREVRRLSAWIKARCARHVAHRKGRGYCSISG